LVSPRISSLPIAINMGKRAANVTTKAPARKAQKVSSPYAPILDAIAQAVQIGRLEPGAADLLAAIAPAALGEAAAQRHNVQVTVIKMLEEVTQTVQAHLQEEVDLASKKVQELVNSKDSLETTVQEAQQVLEGSIEDCTAKKTALVDANTKVAEAKEAAKIATKTRQLGEATLAETTQQQSAFAQTMEAHFKVLLAGDFGEESPEQHKAAVVQLIEQVGIEDSYRLSFGPVCVKPSADRTQFDTLVLQAVSETLEAKAKESVAKVAELAEVSKNNTAESDAADRALEDVQVVKQVAEASLAEASKRADEAQIASREAQTQRDEFETVFGQATLERDMRGERLQAFGVNTVAVLERLRDGVAPQEEGSAQLPKVLAEAPSGVTEEASAAVLAGA